MNKKSGCAGTSVVLLYHRIGWPRLRSLVAGQYVAQRLFASQLDYLANSGWQNVGLSDMVEQCTGAPRPDNDQFCVTFDDGFLSFYDQAWPELAKRNMTGLVYVVAGGVGGTNEWNVLEGDIAEPMMTNQQMRELADNGIEIGSHTLSHPRLASIPDDQLEREMKDSRARLEDIIGREVVSFAYPYGNYDQRVIDAAIAAGYTSATSTKLGVVLDGTNTFEIPRVNVRWNAVSPLLARKIRRARRASGLE